MCLFAFGVLLARPPLRCAHVHLLPFFRCRQKHTTFLHLQVINHATSELQATEAPEAKGSVQYHAESPEDTGTRLQTCSLANVGAFALYTDSNAMRHGRHKLCTAGAPPRYIDDPALERCHAVAPLLCLPQLGLGPRPDIFSGIKVGRLRGPLL